MNKPTTAMIAIATLTVAFTPTVAASDHDDGPVHFAPCARPDALCKTLDLTEQILDSVEFCDDGQVGVESALGFVCVTPPSVSSCDSGEVGLQTSEGDACLTVPNPCEQDLVRHPEIRDKYDPCE